MTVGLNNIGEEFLYQLVRQMNANKEDTLTFTRDDVLHEIGSRAFNSRMTVAVRRPIGQEDNREYETCEICGGRYVKGQGMAKHKSTHNGRGNATVGEFATLTDEEDTL